MGPTLEAAFIFESSLPTATSNPFGQLVKQPLIPYPAKLVITGKFHSLVILYQYPTEGKKYKIQNPLKKKTNST